MRKPYQPDDVVKDARNNRFVVVSHKGFMVTVKDKAGRITKIHAANLTKVRDWHLKDILGRGIGELDGVVFLGKHLADFEVTLADDHCPL